MGVESVTPGLRDGTRLGMNNSPSESESWRPNQSLELTLVDGAVAFTVLSGDVALGLLLTALLRRLSLADIPSPPAFVESERWDLPFEVADVFSPAFGEGELFTGDDGLAPTGVLFGDWVVPPLTESPVTSSSHCMSRAALRPPTEPEELGR